MNSRMRKSVFRRGTAWAVCVSLLLVSGAAAGKRDKPIVTKTKFDPQAKKVDLFEGMEQGKLDVRMIPKDSSGGNILFENTTDEPLTVQLPEAFVGVQVLEQFGCGGGGGFGGGGEGGFGGEGGYGGGESGGGGRAQAMGGGMGGMGGMGGGMGGMGGGMGGMGGGFFSVPPEKIVRVPFRSVCLEHGKPEPSPQMTYRLLDADKVIKDPRLKALLKLVGAKRIDNKVAQAAAWHLANDMSWRQLASQRVDRLGGVPDTPYFKPAHLFRARQLVAFAAQKAEEDAKDRTERSRSWAPRSGRRQR